MDIISPKCFVCIPKGHQDHSPDLKEKFIFKVINSYQIENYCGTKKPTDKQISKIIDSWIYVTPKSPHIVSAYEVFKDKILYLQLTEYCDGYEDIYTKIRLSNYGLITEVIPQKLIRMAYLYTIQISHAFAIAHANNLTHGIFDLSQVIVDPLCNTFKIINFRPWLAKTKQYAFSKEC